MIESDAFSDLFAPEAECGLELDAAAVTAWKVLLVDDEKDIHAVLSLALRDMQVEENHFNCWMHTRQPKPKRYWPRIRTSR